MRSFGPMSGQLSSSGLLLESSGAAFLGCYSRIGVHASKLGVEFQALEVESRATITFWRASL